MNVINACYGRFRVLDGDTIISRSLKLHGEWAQPEIDLITRFIRQGSMVAECNSLEDGVPVINWCRERKYQVYGVLRSAYNSGNYTGDDLALLLLHKPQCPHEVFAYSEVAAIFSLAYPSLQADRLNQVVSERDGQIAGLNQVVAEIEASRSWRWTRIIRLATAWMARRTTPSMPPKATTP